MDWYTNEIIDGLTKLMSLSLDRTPAADSVQITALTWIDVTTKGRTWEQGRDTPRIRGAFSTLGLTHTQWPAPKHFLDALPRVEQAVIGYVVKPATPAESAAAIARIHALLGEAMPNHRPPAAKRDAPPIDKAAVEAELHAHYAAQAGAP